MQTPTPPPLTRMQAILSPSLSPQPPPPQCLYDQRHFPNSVALQLASPDFATQTGGAKGALAPTISTRPPFAHPPPLCRSFHSHGCPRCAPWFTRPAPHPIPPCPPSPPACQGAQEGQRAPSPLFPGYAACKGKGCMQGDGEGVQASKQEGLCTNRRGHAPFPHPLRPVDQLRKIPCTVLVNKI